MSGMGSQNSTEEIISCALKTGEDADLFDQALPDTSLEKTKETKELEDENESQSDKSEQSLSKLACDSQAENNSDNDTMNFKGSDKLLQDLTEMNNEIGFDGEDLVQNSECSTPQMNGSNKSWEYVKSNSDDLMPDQPKQESHNSQNSLVTLDIFSQHPSEGTVDDPTHSFETVQECNYKQGNFEVTSPNVDDNLRNAVKVGLPKNLKRRWKENNYQPLGPMLPLEPQISISDTRRRMKCKFPTCNCSEDPKYPDTHYHCSICRKYTTVIERSMLRHYVMCHQIVPDGAFVLTCCICSLINIHQSEYVRHLKNHASNAYMFTEDVIRHLRSEIEEGEKKFAVGDIVFNLDNPKLSNPSEASTSPVIRNKDTPYQDSSESSDEKNSSKSDETPEETSIDNLNYTMFPISTHPKKVFNKMKKKKTALGQYVQIRLEPNGFKGTVIKKSVNLDKFIKGDSFLCGFCHKANKKLEDGKKSMFKSKKGLLFHVYRFHHMNAPCSMFHCAICDWRTTIPNAFLAHCDSDRHKKKMKLNKQSKKQPCKPKSSMKKVSKLANANETTTVRNVIESQELFKKDMSHSSVPEQGMLYTYPFTSSLDDILTDISKKFPRYKRAQTYYHLTMKYPHIEVLVKNVKERYLNMKKTPEGYKCNFCKFKTKQPRDCAGHVSSQHGQEVNYSLYMCELCDYKTGWCKNFKSHCLRSAHLSNMEDKKGTFEGCQSYKERVQSKSKLVDVKAKSASASCGTSTIVISPSELSPGVEEMNSVSQNKNDSKKYYLFEGSDKMLQIRSDDDFITSYIKDLQELPKLEKKSYMGNISAVAAGFESLHKSVPQLLHAHSDPVILHITQYGTMMIPLDLVEKEKQKMVCHLCGFVSEDEHRFLKHCDTSKHYSSVSDAIEKNLDVLSHQNLDNDKQYPMSPYHVALAHIVEVWKLKVNFETVYEILMKKPVPKVIDHESIAQYPCLQEIKDNGRFAAIAAGMAPLYYSVTDLLDSYPKNVSVSITPFGYSIQKRDGTEIIYNCEICETKQTPNRKNFLKHCSGQDHLAKLLQAIDQGMKIMIMQKALRERGIVVTYKPSPHNSGMTLISANTSETVASSSCDSSVDMNEDNSLVSVDGDSDSTDAYSTNDENDNIDVNRSSVENIMPENAKNIKQVILADGKEAYTLDDYIPLQKDVAKAINELKNNKPESSDSRVIFEVTTFGYTQRMIKSKGPLKILSRVPDMYKTKCDICKGLLFDSATKYEEHMIEQHQDICKNLFHCKLCPYKCLSAKWFTKHCAEESHISKIQVATLVSRSVYQEQQELTKTPVIKAESKGLAQNTKRKLYHTTGSTEDGVQISTNQKELASFSLLQSSTRIISIDNHETNQANITTKTSPFSIAQQPDSTSQEISDTSEGEDSPSSQKRKRLSISTPEQTPKKQKMTARKSTTKTPQKKMSSPKVIEIKCTKILDDVDSDVLYEELLSRKNIHPCECGLIFTTVAAYYIHVGCHYKGDHKECNYCGYKARNWMDFHSHFYQHESS